MRDIAMCFVSVAKDCPRASTCYRALAEPCEWGQEWFLPKKPGKDCPDYILEVSRDERRHPLKEEK